MSLNLASILSNSTRSYPENIALVHDEQRVTYAELSRAVEAFAAHLHRAGVGRGDKVALLMHNRISFTVA